MSILFSFPAPSDAPAVVEGRALSALTAIVSWKHVANVEGYQVSLFIYSNSRYRVWLELDFCYNFLFFFKLDDEIIYISMKIDAW